MTENALHDLAERAGIVREWVAAWGEKQVVADEALRTMLGALGLPAESDSDVRRSRTRLDELDRDRLVDPVAVVVAANQSGVFVATTVGGEWRIDAEDGRVFEGRLWQRAAAEAGQVFPRSSGGCLIELPPDIPSGYHGLRVASGGKSSEGNLIVAPQRAYLHAEWLEAPFRRDWAITAQLYSLRSSRNWGIGDFSDLSELARAAASRGAAALGLNPLHALFPSNPAQVSPYSPSSRTFLNPIYIDVAAVPEFEKSEDARRLAGSVAFQQRIDAARASLLVDYVAVWAAKREALEALHCAFRAEHLGPAREPRTERGRAFREWQREMGSALEKFALFEALHEHFARQGAGLAWRDWPAPFRDPSSDEAEAFAREHALRVEFSQYLQFEADRQLGAAARGMRDGGMSAGLYRDVAVGVDPNGADAWSDQALLVAGASIGAPPDIYNPKGQDWGLAPFSPLALKERAYAPFIAAVRANMRHAGAVRIDHVIGLQRLWWVPRSGGAADGAYVRYPLDDLIGIIALESERRRCLVVGEDLGTVPEGFREEMQARGILSYRLLMFERENGDGAFLPPDAYPDLAAAAVSTHDLATLRGLWRGRDIDWRRELGLYPSEEHAAKDVAFRDATRRALVESLAAAGGLDEEAALLLLGEAWGKQDGTRRLAEAAHRFLARTPSRLMLVQLEDLVRELDQMNLPGTVDEHPNWRRKLRLSIDSIFDDEFVRRILRVVDETRGEPLPKTRNPGI
jgi:4-alpha-glucanotransferase